MDNNIVSISFTFCGKINGNNIIVNVVIYQASFDHSEEISRQTPDDDRAADQDGHTSPTWDIQTHTFETVYHVIIPDNPARDGDSHEVQEFSPTVVSRSVKRSTPVITSGDDDLEEETQYFTSTTEVQFSEPSTDFQLEYPENDRVFTTDERDVSLTDEEWITRHTFEKGIPDISALQASFDHSEEIPQQSGDSSI
ncbi:hypothetical protein ACROYT_G040395 [Oculina patagonica]